MIDILALLQCLNFGFSSGAICCGPVPNTLLVGDESIVTRAGKMTHGLDHFFASLYGRVVPSLAFFEMSLVDVTERRSYPVMVEQVVRPELFVVFE